MTADELKTYWADCATKYIDWITPFETILEGDFSNLPVKWFKEGTLNLSANCLDRHMLENSEKLALIFEGDDPTHTKTYTFKALLEAVCLMANFFKAQGIKKGDVIALYLPLEPNALIAMLASARIGAIHTVVFAGFSGLSLKDRLIDSKAKLLVTTTGFQRGGKWVDLATEVAKATDGLSLTCIYLDKTSSMASCSNVCDPTPMQAEDPLFILYTSGSTGKPKGLVHTTGGYAVQVATSFHDVFTPKTDDVFWCTADVGWITGHSYLVYGALLTGTTTVMFGGVPTYPTPSRYFELIEKWGVTIFYTAPTAIRAIKREGDDWIKSCDLSRLRLLGSVGEPINPDIWLWYYEVIGQKRCPIVDTWWQTETGAIMISPRRDGPLGKPGSATKPLSGIEVALLDADDTEIEHEGALAIRYPWPSMARTILGDATRYQQTYFHKGYYITGDGARCDKDGDYWITGRIDDVLNVAGHRLGTAEIESALVHHPMVAEAAVVGFPHDIKGQGIYAFVSLKSDAHATSRGSSAGSTETLITTLKQTVATQLSPIAKPDKIQIVTDLPKTRSGKIMRRILRLIAEGRVHSLEDLGDLSTLANPSIVENLLQSHDC